MFLDIYEYRTLSGIRLHSNRVGDHIAFGTPKGLIRFSQNSNRFVPDPTLGSRYADGSRDVSNVLSGPSGSVLVSGTTYHDLLIPNNGSYQLRSMPLLATKIRAIYGAHLD